MTYDRRFRVYWLRRASMEIFDPWPATFRKVVFSSTAAFMSES